MGKFSELLGKRFRRNKDEDEKWLLLGEHCRLAVKICEAAPDQVDAQLAEWRNAGKSDGVEQIMQSLAEGAKLQLRAAEQALLRLQEAKKLRLVPEVGGGER
jgi:hypothetical protein